MPSVNWNDLSIPEGHKWTPDDPDAEPELDPAKQNPKVAAAIVTFQQALAGLVQQAALTQSECVGAARDLVEMAAQEPVLSYEFFEVLINSVFPGAPGDRSGVTPQDMEGPVYYPGAPMMDNPGVLPMRPDEPGTPLIVSGQIRTVDGTPLAGAEIDIWNAAINGHYSNTGLDPAQPDFNLRGRMIADGDGRYEFRGIKPVPYNIPVLPQTLLGMMQSLGMSIFRARHIHFKIRHPELAEEFMTQLYFRSDPYLRTDPISMTRPDDIDDMMLDVVRHDDPQELAERGLDQPFETATFDFCLQPAGAREPSAAASAAAS